MANWPSLYITDIVGAVYLTKQCFRQTFWMPFYHCEILFRWIVGQVALTHWGRMTHICVDNLTINCAVMTCRQTIIWTNAGISFIGPLGTHFSEIVIEIHMFSFKKISSGKCRPFCLGLNVIAVWTSKHVNECRIGIAHEPEQIVKINAQWANSP